MSGITIGLATPTNEPELRQLLRNNPMPGRISISFEREPDYFIGARVEAPFHQVILARDSSNGSLIGMGTRSVRDVYLNGVAQPVGYLSQFRVDSRYRTMRKTFLRSFDYLYELHQDKRVPFYYSSIIEDNLLAHRLFSKQWPGMPQFQPYARMHTLAIYCRRKRRRLSMPKGLTFVQGNFALKGAILDCLQRNGSRFQLTPVWTGETLFDPVHTPNLEPENFFLAVDGKTVVGCLAVWYQGGFKQTIVRGYSGVIDRWRKLINISAPLGGWPVLPPPNTPFHYCFASHLAIDHDNPQVFAALLRSVYNHATTYGYSYFMLGLSEANRLLPIVTNSYRNIKYTSQLYLVDWENGEKKRIQVDTHPPHPEVSIL
jgi:hypothetical protein